MKYERLTYRQGKGIGIINNDDSPDNQRIYTAIERLVELEDKIENRTLIELPCKIGDTIYMVYQKRAKVTANWFWIIKKSKLSFANMERVLKDFGNYVFLTRLDAEIKLKELQ